MECPCCRECVIYETAIAAALNRMPSPTQFQTLDRQLPVAYVSPCPCLPHLAHAMLGRMPGPLM
jgi:hypothetical protein